MKVIGIIPARMASSRFPGKPLAKILGVPMIGHVYLRSKMAQILDEVYVATCDVEIADYVESIGGKPVMTSDKHQRASDRAYEAMINIEKETGQSVDIVVMIQGDEPKVFPEMIEVAVQSMIDDQSVSVVSLMAPIKTVEEHEDPNEVKVVIDKQGYALYFSREPIPSRKKWDNEVPMYRQVAIIPFKRDFLIKFYELDPTPLEEIESIDMLRIMEHGYRVKMVSTDFETCSVDTPEDLRLAEELMTKDTLVAQYASARM